LNGHNEVVKFLVERALESNMLDIRDSLLHISVLLENEEIFRFLVSKGSSINAQNASGDTPLHLAVVYRNNTFVNLLTEEMGCDISIRNNEGLAPYEQEIYQDPHDLVEEECILNIPIRSQHINGKTYFEKHQVSLAYIQDIPLEFNEFPQEVLLRILWWLYFKDLCRMRAVNRKFKALADDPTLWKHLCDITFGGLRKPANIESYKLFFQAEIGTNYYRR
jgi:hypothetical protein